MMMTIRITKEPDSGDDEDEHYLVRTGKILIPFFAFFVLALTIGEAWESLELNARAVVILLVMAVATFFYRKELSDILLD